MCYHSCSASRRFEHGTSDESYCILGPLLSREQGNMFLSHQKWFGLHFARSRSRRVAQSLWSESKVRVSYIP